MKKQNTMQKITLTDRGKKQARQTGEYLKNIFGDFDIVNCSPIQRFKDVLKQQI